MGNNDAATPTTKISGDHPEFDVDREIEQSKQRLAGRVDAHAAILQEELRESQGLDPRSSKRKSLAARTDDAVAGTLATADQVSAARGSDICYEGTLSNLRHEGQQQERGL